MFYKIGQSLKPFLLLVDIMSRKAFCYSIPGEKNMTKIITAYNKFLQDVDYVKGVEGLDANPVNRATGHLSPVPC
jgi:hypothetical protein